MFNKTEALIELGITEEIYDEMLFEFVIQARDNLAILESSCKAGDLKKARSIIHSLKGVAGNLRVTSAYNSAVTFEEAIGTGHTQEIGDNLLKFIALINKLFLELNK